LAIEIVDWRLPIEIVDWRLPIGGCRLAVADWRLPIGGYRLRLSVLTVADFDDSPIIARGRK
jgi:hypothetical protein